MSSKGWTSMNKPLPPPSTAIDYNLFTRNALRGVIREALAQVARYGLPGAHHFYISFDTTHEGTVLPDFLHAAYPRQMSIVLQHRFSDLQAGEEGFSVTLSFKNRPQRLTIPYAAILDFTDPAAGFRLHFPRDKGEESDKAGKGDKADKADKGKEKYKRRKSGNGKEKASVQAAQEDGDSRVVRVDFPKHRSRQKETGGEG